MKLTATALGLSVTTALLAGCGGGGDDPGSPSGGGDVVDGGTFTMAIAGDPGKLDPHSSASTQLFTVNQLAYDNLVAVNGDGEIESQLASEWTVDGTTVTFTLNDNITCADGSDFTATTVVDNIAYVGDPKSKSPYLGTFLPAGATAKADDAAGTVTVTLAQPAPFVLNGFASLPMVCESGLADRPSLAAETAGTGPYELTEAVPGDRYTYQIRDGYAWGPDGASTDETGMPDTVIMKVVQNEGTAANLLLSGEVNAATIQGPDVKRLDGAKLFSNSTPAMVGEQWYNHNEGRETSDAEVRMALTTALDLDELASVATAGEGTPATTLASLAPTSCPGDSISEALPAQDVDAAKAALDGREVTFLYSSAAGTAVSAAAELAAQQWEAAGAKVTTKALDETALQGVIFGTGDWDIAWVPLNVSSPDQLVPFLSGPGVAEGGTNFAGIDNPDYTAAVQEATAMNGVEGCDTWLEAESNLVAAADLVPFANNQVKTFGNGAEFEYPGQLVPTSIRMLAK
ncbi:ABC transporter substrate-binding protein [Nocardioides sp. cx-173]|uniref:ABC transporter substrate-binding protein n=1 Tax=Nocardioides sp. cx-173 TaxID=2898796 RepID=UPI001E2EEB31|nr:ABC transporter substrate-binding protein [Nocardioides sp. cx-173]MCD4523967.1 ABC transporter substrate-binding protein [Nocardioides sp. cx-173]UGB41370.1 ABC transporter substrate-binding protein [Nocardioides sp. cx-173]